MLHLALAGLLGIQSLSTLIPWSLLTGSLHTMHPTLLLLSVLTNILGRPCDHGACMLSTSGIGVAKAVYFRLWRPIKRRVTHSLVTQRLSSRSSLAARGGHFPLAGFSGPFVIILRRRLMNPFVESPGAKHSYLIVAC